MKQYKLLKDLKQGDVLNIDLGEGITQEVKSVRWKPELGENYYVVMIYLYGDGYRVIQIKFSNDFTDKINLARNNAYRTTEEAKQWQKVLEFRDEFNLWYWEVLGDWVPDWNDTDQPKHTFFYNWDDKEWGFDDTIQYEWYLHYFPTAELRNKAIDRFGDRLHMLSPMYRIGGGK
jgi:hypothetical protein